MTRSLEEAQSEAARAAAFGRQAPEWAAEMIAESSGGDEGAAAASVPDVRALFEEAGLCEESADKAARGLEAGRYLSFADAALAQTVFDGLNGQPRRNRYASPARIAEVAKKATARGSLVERGAPAASGLRIQEG
jgi:hypothetical protein